MEPARSRAGIGNRPTGALHRRAGCRVSTSQPENTTQWGWVDSPGNSTGRINPFAVAKRITFPGGRFSMIRRVAPVMARDLLDT